MVPVFWLLSGSDMPLIQDLRRSAVLTSRCLMRAKAYHGAVSCPSNATQRKVTVRKARPMCLTSLCKRSSSAGQIRSRSANSMGMFIVYQGMMWAFSICRYIACESDPIEGRIAETRSNHELSILDIGNHTTTTFSFAQSVWRGGFTLDESSHKSRIV